MHKLLSPSVDILLAKKRRRIVNASWPFPFCPTALLIYYFLLSAVFTSSSSLTTASGKSRQSTPTVAAVECGRFGGHCIDYTRCFGPFWHVLHNNHSSSGAGGDGERYDDNEVDLCPGRQRNILCCIPNRSGYYYYYYYSHLPHPLYYPYHPYYYHHPAHHYPFYHPYNFHPHYHPTPSPTPTPTTSQHPQRRPGGPGGAGREQAADRGHERGSHRVDDPLEPRRLRLRYAAGATATTVYGPTGGGGDSRADEDETRAAAAPNIIEQTEMTTSGMEEMGDVIRPNHCGCSYDYAEGDRGASAPGALRLLAYFTSPRFGGQPISSGGVYNQRPLMTRRVDSDGVEEDGDGNDAAGSEGGGGGEGISLHSEGRAVDIKLSGEQADVVFNHAVEIACRVGIQEVIHNGRVWTHADGVYTFSRRDGGDNIADDEGDDNEENAQDRATTIAAPYSHTEHIHIGLNRCGAEHFDFNS